MLGLKMIAMSALLLATPALADVTLGAGTNVNCFPFGCSIGAGTIYQQVYSATALGPITITGVSFSGGSGALADSTYTLSVSTTAAGVDALDLVNFGNNLGADDHVVFSDVLAPHYDGTTLTLTFSSPYAFDPAAGNLLLNFSISPGVTGISGTGYFRADAGDAGGVFSRAHNFGSAFIGFGLQTTFLTGATVPEPVTWALMIGGFGTVGAAMRRHRAVAA